MVRKVESSKPPPFNDEIWDLRVAVLGEERAAIRTPEDGKRSPVEMF
jgi:hypothetical protein